MLVADLGKCGEDENPFIECREKNPNIALSNTTSTHLIQKIKNFLKSFNVIAFSYKFGEIMRLFLLFFLFASPLILAELPEEQSRKKPPIEPFTENAAMVNDWILKKGGQSSILKPISWGAGRVVSLGVFPLCAAADLALNVGTGNWEGTKSCFLGLVTSPAGVISPDLVTHHFLPIQKRTEKVVPYGKLHQRQAYQFFPTTVEEVQEVIRFAVNENKTISVMGSGMSQGAQAIANQEWQIILQTSGLNHIDIEAEKKVAKVGAGATWKDLQNEANRYGLAIKVMQASNIFSIGGSISANCHGWDHQTGTLKETVLSLTMVDPRGNVVLLTPKDQLFHYVVGGYGGLGVILEAEIQLTDNVCLFEKGTEIPPESYYSYFLEEIKNNPKIDMHLYRLSLEPKSLFKTGVAVNYFHLSDDASKAPLKEEPEMGSRLDRAKLHAIRRLDWLRSYAWAKEKSETIIGKMGTRNQLMRPPINPIFNSSSIDTEWLQEYFVRGEDLPDFLQYLAKVLQENNVSLFNASVRYVKHDPETALSYAADGDRFAVVLFFNQKVSKKAIVKTNRWVRQVNSYLLDHGGSYYLPYQPFATLEQFRKSYPRWRQVKEMKQEIDPQSIFANGFYENYIMPEERENSFSSFRFVFDRQSGMRDEMKAFLNNIFMQLNDQKFFSLVDSILEDSSLDDQEIYQKLYRKIHFAKPNKIASLKHGLNALNSLKKDLSTQAHVLLQDKQEILGYVEIGYPGRLIRPLRKHLPIKGPIYVVNERESYSDYIESGWPRPYDAFVSLRDYEPIPEEKIPSESVDLVACYIGLHHVQPEKLDGFVKSIYRILRPGGSFILMDHDAYDNNMIVLADVVHSVFNAATGVLPEDNQKEIRHFKPLQDWISYLEMQDFTYHPIGVLIRNGDPTLNSLVRFDKKESAVELVKANFEKEKLYTRPQMKTYLTGPEWQNVRAAKRYATFLETQPSYQFPFFEEIGGYWKVYGSSWEAARQESSFSDVVMSEYNLMNLFVGTSMTLEYGIKGILSVPLSLVDSLADTSSDRESLIQPERERIKEMQEYGEHIEHTPFYQYPFFQEIQHYWNSYAQYWKDAQQERGLIPTIFSPKSAKCFLMGIGMTVENSVKGIVSAPLRGLFGSGELKEADCIHALVKDPNNQILFLDERVNVVEDYQETYLKHLEIPRYMSFKEILMNLSKDPEISCVSIAGQSKIQVDTKRRINTPIVALPEMKKLYQIPAPSDTSHIYEAFEIKVEELLQALRTLQKLNIEVLLIHDF